MPGDGNLLYLYIFNFQNLKGNLMNLKIRSVISFCFIFFVCILIFNNSFAQVVPRIADEYSDWVEGRPDKCTTITVGKKASADGWVTTSHTCDSHRTRSWFDIIQAQKHKKGAEKKWDRMGGGCP